MNRNRMNAGLTLSRIPFKNLRGHPVRTFILFLLASVQAFLLFGGALSVSSLQRELALCRERLGADILVYPSSALSRLDKSRLIMQGTPAEVYKDRSGLSRLDSCEGISERSYQLFFQSPRPDGGAMWIRGYDPQTDFAVAPWISEGEEYLPEKGQVLAGSDVDVAADGTVLLFGRAFPVCARLYRTGAEDMDGAVFADLETIRTILAAAEEAGIDTYKSVDPDRDYSCVLLRVKDKGDTESITDWINVYVRKNKAVRTGNTISDAAQGIQGQKNLILGLTAVSILLAGGAQAVVMHVMSGERKREWFVWKAIGASDRKILRIYLRESALIQGSGAIPGMLLGGTGALILSHVLAASREMRVRSPSLSEYLVLACLTAAVSLGIGLWAAFLSVRKTMKERDAQMLTL